MDISKLSLPELLELQSKLPAEIESRKLVEKEKIIDQLAEMARDKGYSLEELLSRPRKSGTTKKSFGTKKVAPKYRHPDNKDMTWTGRGRKPAWVVEWLAKGNPLAALAI
jgi:DNA-binding protein H-NS